jgi:hypothetical protein
MLHKAFIDPSDPSLLLVELPKKPGDCNQVNPNDPAALSEAEIGSKTGYSSATAAASVFRL